MSSPRLRLDARVAGLEPSATLAIQERSRALAKQGRDVIRLGLGQSPFPVPDVVVEALRAHAREKDYLPVGGLEALRAAVANYHEARHGISARAEDVLVAPGSKELMFLLQIVHDGDLLIPTPAWVSYEPQARIVGRRPVLIHTRKEDDYKLRAEQLDALAAESRERSLVLILNYPSNPTGTTFSAGELDALAEVARRHAIVVLSDEIYGELHHEGAHESIARRYPEGTIISSGLSKWCGAGGWRLGTFVFPPELAHLRRAMAAVASETYTSTSAPIQYAAVRAFERGEAIESYLGRSRAIVSALARATTARLRESGAVLPDPSGAFYVYPDFEAHRARLARRGITSSPELAEALLEQVGVACLPASDFGRPSNELALRLSLVDFDGASALLAMATRDTSSPPDEELLEQHCGRVLEATRRIGAWMCVE